MSINKIYKIIKATYLYVPVIVICNCNTFIVTTVSSFKVAYIFNKNENRFTYIRKHSEENNIIHPN